MPNIAFCIFCESLDVSETTTKTEEGEIVYEYFCYECREGWADDESEYEVGV